MTKEEILKKHGIIFITTDMGYEYTDHVTKGNIYKAMQEYGEQEYQRGLNKFKDNQPVRVFSGTGRYTRERKEIK